MNEIYETVTRWLGGTNTLGLPNWTAAAMQVPTLLVLAYAARRVWRWWRGRKVRTETEGTGVIQDAFALVYNHAPWHDVTGSGSPEDLYPTDFGPTVAPGTPYGSAPDESGRPITEHRCRELINERHEALDKRRFDRIYDRLAALEAAQKPAPPKVTSGGSGFVAPVWPSGCGVGGIGGAPAWANGLYIEPRSNRSATGVWRVGESYLTSPQGVLIRGHWWRAFNGGMTYLCRDSMEVAYRDALHQWRSTCNPWAAGRFADFTELPAHETAAVVLDWLAQGEK